MSDLVEALEKMPTKTKPSISVPAGLTPREIVAELDKHIIGQADAKRAVAIALRNRWRRMKLAPELRDEVMPKNILMIGPTGVGKTEIARRLAKLAKAPFIKVEATKFTEVGYVGRDVDSIIRDLADVAVKLTREQEVKKVQHLAEEAAYERILDILLPRAVKKSTDMQSTEVEKEISKKEDTNATRSKFRKQLLKGELDEKEIDVNVASGGVGVEIMSPPGMEEMTSQLQSMFQNLGGDRKKNRKLKIKDALKILHEEEATRLIDEEALKTNAITSVEQNGIVFIDELDKVAKRSDAGGGDVSREGVQRDLLPMVEGCTVSTKYGMVNTDHILFVASGAFHVAKPSDLIPELQGRLPIRVELKALEVGDFVRILTEPDASLAEQYTALLGTEGLKLKFTKDGIRKIAEIAYHVNERIENIGARRLHTVLERLLEELSYTASDATQKSISINAKYVTKHVGDLAQDEDLSKYIL